MLKSRNLFILFGLLGMSFFVLVALAACQPDMLHASAPIRLKDPWLRRQPETQSGELYLYITNRGEVDDALIAVSSEAATQVEMYNSLAGNHVSDVEQVSAIDLPVDSGLFLLPGGPHIKLIGLNDIKPGQLIPITLTFEQAGAFSFYVEAH